MVRPAAINDKLTWLGPLSLKSLILGIVDIDTSLQVNKVLFVEKEHFLCFNDHIWVPCVELFHKTGQLICYQLTQTFICWID